MNPDVIKNGGPAFPCEWDYINSNREAANGMLLRDYFAAKAMQAHIARFPMDSLQDMGDGEFDALMARWAYEQADAMLKARAA